MFFGSFSQTFGEFGIKFRQRESLANHSKIAALRRKWADTPFKAVFPQCRQGLGESVTETQVDFFFKWFFKNFQ